jgi:hypothetical protein
MEANGMTKTKSNASTGSDWNVSFWFAVLSPVLGILVGFLAQFLFYPNNNERKLYRLAQENGR